MSKLSTRKILIATKNPGKFGEICEVLTPLNAHGLEFVSLKDVGIEADCPEDGDSFEENAAFKARFYSKLAGLPTVADDSGIWVNALAGELGVKTRRWGAGEKASDQEWMDFFMNRMRAEQDRQACFVCVAAFVDPATQRDFLARGETRGLLADSLKAPMIPGIPLSSIFYPEGLDQVYSQLSLDEKNKLSHRGKAFAALYRFLMNSYA